MHPLTPRLPIELSSAGASPPERGGDDAMRGTAPPRSSSLSDRERSGRGTSFEHQVLLALIMAVVMTATVLLYR